MGWDIQGKVEELGMLLEEGRTGEFSAAYLAAYSQAVQLLEGVARGFSTLNRFSAEHGDELAGFEVPEEVDEGIALLGERAKAAVRVIVPARH